MKSVVAFGLCVLLFTLFAGDSSLPALVKARRNASRLSLEISSLRAENARLKARADALRHDPPTIEIEARQTLGLARPDEIVVTRPR
jgi:cell division protein FtsB